jgi:hypothetical protein
LYGGRTQFAVQYPKTALFLACFVMLVFWLISDFVQRVLHASSLQLVDVQIRVSDSMDAFANSTVTYMAKIPDMPEKVTEFILTTPTEKLLPLIFKALMYVFGFLFMQWFLFGNPFFLFDCLGTWGGLATRNSPSTTATAGSVRGESPTRRVLS